MIKFAAKDGDRYVIGYTTKRGRKIIKSFYTAEETGYYYEKMPKEIVKGTRNNYGFVYLIHDTQTNCYKIGLSKNPSKRLSSLQTATPNKLVLLHEIETSRMSSLEKELHYKFQANHLNGEWYALSDNDIRYIRSL